MTKWHISAYPMYWCLFRRLSFLMQKKWNGSPSSRLNGSGIHCATSDMSRAKAQTNISKQARLLCPRPSETKDWIVTCILMILYEKFRNDLYSFHSERGVSDARRQSYTLTVSPSLVTLRDEIEAITVFFTWRVMSFKPMWVSWRRWDEPYHLWVVSTLYHLYYSIAALSCSTHIVR